MVRPMRVLLVLAHPCTESLAHAVAATATGALTGAGHSVDVIDLYALDVRAEMSLDEWTAYHGDDPLRDPMLVDHADRLRAADALVFVYPTWWSSTPAILKGWIERLLVPGVGFAFDDARRVRPALGNVRRIVGISTYGSARLYVRLINDNGRRLITRTLRSACGLRTRTDWLALYSIDTADERQRRRFLARVERRMRAL